YVEGEAVISPSARNADPERCKLRAPDVDAGRAGLALGAFADEIDHRLLQQPDEALHLDAASREVDERVEDELPGTVIGDLAAAVRAHYGNRVRHARRPGALPERVNRRMLEQPDLVRGGCRARSGMGAHRLERRRVLDASE